MIGFFIFVVNDSNAEIAVPVKSVSELETAYSRARMELGKPEYLRMDNQQNLVSNDPSTLTAFEAPTPPKMSGGPRHAACPSRGGGPRRRSA